MAKNNNQIPNRVYEALKAEILSMRLEPGYSISEIETSKRFNVSRTPVRDAFRRLESDGLIEVKPHIGTFVSLIDLETISDIMYMREKVEIGIVEDLATIITQAQIFRLKVILVKQKELLSRESDDKELSLEFINLDNDFHRMIFELAGKEGVWEMLNQLQNHYLRFRVFIDLNDKKRLSKLLDAHETILECIIQKDMTKIKDLYQHHLYDGVQDSTTKIFEYAKYFKYVSNIQ